MERLSPVFWTLKLTFGLVPIVAGLDKFTNLLVSWDKYLAPPFAGMVPAHGFMMLVGIIEIIVGLGVLLTPWTRLFAWIAAIWLWCIALNLIIGCFFDIAVRDIVMGISATVLARLSLMVPEDVRTRGSVLKPARV